jgi:cytochrome P450
VSRLPDPPGPAGLPFFGSRGDLRRNPMLFFNDIAQRYGGIVRFFYGRKPTFLVADPALIKELLVDRRTNYVKNRRYAVLQRAIGIGLLTSEGETWKEQRRATQDGLAKQTIREQVPWTVEVIAEHLERWRSLAGSGRIVDVEESLTLIVEDLIGCWVFGPRFRGDLGKRFTELVTTMRANWPKQPRRLIELRLPNPAQTRRLRRAFAGIDKLIYDAIRRQRENDTVDYSLLSSLANARVGSVKRRFSDRELRDQLLTLFHAGFETSASQLTFLFYRLSLQPEIRLQLFDEIGEIIGDRPPTADDLPRLEYTEWCLDESLRLYPPAYNFTRVALADDSLGGFHIPANSMVIVSPYATHRLPGVWPNPEGFDPERFAPENVAGRSPFAFIPFGAGHRFCVGAPLAQVQTKLVTAMVCQRYELDVAPGYVAEPAPGTVMRPAAGMPMTIRRRHITPPPVIAGFFFEAGSVQ